MIRASGWRTTTETKAAPVPTAPITAVSGISAPRQRTFQGAR